MHRRWIRIHALAIGTALCAAIPANAEQQSTLQLMSEGDVVGLSMAEIKNGTIVRVSNYGDRNNSRQPVDDQTVFNAASLSKPVFTYAVLQLADAGQISLDEPLSTYLPNYIATDPEAARITAREVLSHTSGLPNGANARYPLKTYFRPGEHFSYSGEGFLYLQKVVEKISGEDLNAMMQRLVFEPLGMQNSSYVWQTRFDGDFAEPYDNALRQSIKPKYPAAKSAWSLETTATDYARFLLGVLRGAHLKPETARRWLMPQVTLTKKCVQCLDDNGADLDLHLAWALGWGVEPDEGVFFQWGDNGNFKSFAMGRLQDQSAIVVLTNSEAGMTIMPDILSGGGFRADPAFAWLGYAHYDGPAQMFIRSVVKNGAEATAAGQDHQAFGEETRRAIATNLSQRGRTEDGLWLREKNAADYPNSAQCHFDLGESYLEGHQFSGALAEFKRAVELDPKQARAASLVKLLGANMFPSPSPDGKIIFRLDGFTDAKSVSVVGTFDGWESAALPMKRESVGWRVSTNLPPGSYIYAYSIDGSLVPDVSNARFLSDKGEPPMSIMVGGEDQHVEALYPPN
jgi:CubicO group peptidase (beta-lactamase class C family)